VPTAAPRSPTRKGLAPRSAPAGVGAAGSPPSLLSETSAVGEAGPAGPGRRPHRRSRSPHPTSPSHNNNSVKKKVDFFSIFSPRRLPDGPPAPPAAVAAHDDLACVRGR